MKHHLKWLDERASGQALIEYILIIVLVVVSAVIALQNLGTTVKNKLHAAGTIVSQAVAHTGIHGFSGDANNAPPPPPIPSIDNANAS